MNNSMFGKFRGFTMRPLQDTPASNPTSPLAPNVAFVQPVSKSGGERSPVTGSRSPTKSPVRAAPAVPKAPKLAIVGRSQSHKAGEKDSKQPSVAKIGRAKTVVGSSNWNEPPALPPLNPGSHPRPLISSPILESSTSTAKEMVSPLHNGKTVVPVRPAPKAEPAKDNNSGEVVDFAMKPLPPINENKGGTLRRFKALMKKEETPPLATTTTTTATPPSPAKHHERKVPKFIDRNRLKTIEISAPIPQLETQNEINNRRSVLARTHSMRKDSPTEEAAQKQLQLLSFGSTRSMTRPKSTVTSRPKSPPPPRPPPLPVAKDYVASAISSGSTPLDSYQRPPAPKKVAFVDPPTTSATKSVAPLASVDSSPATSPDNIYAVIDEERVVEGGLKSTAGDTSMESLGLLGEIVNEMENRNLGSIYSTAGAGARSQGDGPQYANTEDIGGQGEAEDEEDNDAKSNVSTTSSGYLKPIGAVKPVVAGVNKVVNGSINTFKGKAGGGGPADGSTSQPYKSYHASINRPFASQYSVPKGKGIPSSTAAAAASPAAMNSTSSNFQTDEAQKAKKPRTPVKPVLKGAASSAEEGRKSAGPLLSNVARMQKKFETATNKK